MKKTSKAIVLIAAVFLVFIGLGALSSLKKSDNFFGTPSKSAAASKDSMPPRASQDLSIQGSSAIPIEEQINDLVANVGVRAKGYEPQRGIYIRLQEVPPLKERYPNAQKLVEIGQPAIKPLLNALLCHPKTADDSLIATLISLSILSSKSDLEKLLDQMSVGSTPEHLQRIERARLLIRSNM
jgi:hypothetical protein